MTEYDVTDAEKVQYGAEQLEEITNLLREQVSSLTLAHLTAATSLMREVAKIRRIRSSPLGSQTDDEI